MNINRFSNLKSFINETIQYFKTRLDGVDRDRYFADRDRRYILDKCINDIILATVDISEEFLRLQDRAIPDTYKDTILACFEYVGDVVLKIAPLVKNRNEMIHQYLKINWQNIITVMQKTDAVLTYINALDEIIKKETDEKSHRNQIR